MKKIPFPFKIKAKDYRNKDSVIKANLLRTIAKYDWEHGGQKRFFEMFKGEHFEYILKNYKPKSINPLTK